MSTGLCYPEEKSCRLTPLYRQHPFFTPLSSADHPSLSSHQGPDQNKLLRGCLFLKVGCGLCTANTYTYVILSLSPSVVCATFGNNIQKSTLIADHRPFFRFCLSRVERGVVLGRRGRDETTQHRHQRGKWLC